MKINNIRVSRIESDTQWGDEDNFVGIAGVTLHGYACSDQHTVVNITIQATPEELDAFWALVKRIEERVNKEGEM